MEKLTKKDIPYLIIGILYSPIFLIGWVIHKVARVILALGYLLMLRPVNAVSIIFNLFNTENVNYVRRNNKK